MHPHQLHTLYTAHYRYSGPDRTDITVKGKHPVWSAFAPTWEMVMGVKNGTMTKEQYVSLYAPTEFNTSTVIGRVPVAVWDEFLSVPERTLVCFCTEHEFCHRNILLNYLLRVFDGRIAYGGWRN